MISYVTLREHADHGLWSKRGRGIYCACGDPLYQGGLPGTIEKQREVGQGLDELQAAVGAYFKARVAADSKGR